MQWYYVVGKEKAGPFNPDEFNELVNNGTITPKTLIWNKTYENWQRFETIDYQVSSSTTDEVAIAPEKDEFGDDIVADDKENDITLKVDTLEEKEGESEEQRDLTGHTVSFSGSSGEYFKIWIVNLFLTIVTLGIYAAWAKVRTKKYFYANTKLDGESFDYLANPIAILKGNLIIGGSFILFQVAGSVIPALSIIIVLAFFAAFPFLIYKSLCFNARNTSYRNIRFKFNGTLKESYKIFMLLPICFPLTMGLIAPYWTFRVKKYFYENFAFGSAKNKYTGTPGFFYETVLLAMGLMILLLIGMVVIIAAVGVAASALQGSGSPDMRVMQRIIVPLTILFYIVAIVLSTAMKTFIYVKLTNYSFENTSIGDVKVKSDYQTKSLLWIRMTNIPAILFSVGLLAPWAIIRTYNYMAENITVFSDMNLDGFSASKDDDVSAVGESAADFFDMEIGL